MLLAALLVSAPLGTVLAAEGGSRAAATEKASSLEGTLHRDLGGVLTLYRHGSGGLGIPTTFLLGGAPERAVAIGDANGDGTADLAVAEAGSDRVWILLGDGTGGFGPATRLPSGARQSVVAVGDFNGDGINDQAVAEQFAAGVKFLYGDGAGGFRVIESSGDSRLGAALVADFDGDGNADLALVDGVSTYVTILLGDEQGQLRSTTRITVGGAPTAIAAGDFNGDGRTDLAVANKDSGDVAILLGDGAGGFGFATRFWAGSRPTAIAVGDLNGDGRADVVVAHGLAGSVSVLRGDGTGTFGRPTEIAVDIASGPVASANSGSGNSGTTGHPDVYQGILSLTLNPTTIAGGSGASSIGTVTLNAAAPAGGVVVTLASSNFELATMMPSITVPGGATTATFTVGTNALYRRYSGLAFSVTISATHAVTRSATLNVTAQARPTAPARNPDTDLRGLNCAGEAGILFDCKDAVNCVFKQECTLGCLHRPQEGTKWKDVCATTGPFPISLDPRRVVGGNPIAGTLLLSAPAPAGSFGLATNGSLVAGPESRLNMSIPTGATSLGFNVLTAPVNAIQFANFDGHVTTPEPHPQGGIFFASRHARTWAAVVPGTPPPVKLISLTFDATTVRGGLFTAGRACIDQLKPAPEVGDVPLVIVSSTPAVASIGPPSFTQGSNCSTFGVQTSAVAVTTTVTITATLGAQVLSGVITVTATPPATSAQTFISPNPVTGGNTATGTVVLNGLAPAAGAVVTLTSSLPAVVVLPASVTVPGGSDRLSFAVPTTPVATSTNVTTFTDYAGVRQFNSVQVTPAVALTMTSHTLNPTSVASGGSSTGTVTLSGTVPGGSAGAVVTISSSNSAIVSVPANVTVPAGASSATYTATAGSVTATSSVLITANFGGTSLSPTLTVTPAAAAPTLSAVSVNPTSVVGGSPSTGTVTLTSAAPTGGAVVTLSDNSASATVPASVTVPAGQTSNTFTVTTTTVAMSTAVTITGIFGGATRTATLTVTPASAGTLPAPSLVSPANDARFSPGQAITFDWSDVAGAASYTIQIDDADTFTAPLTTTQTVTVSQYTNSTLPTTRMWWRVRANDSAGTPGAWSAVRRFEVKN